MAHQLLAPSGSLAGRELYRDVHGVPYFIFVRPEKTATESLTRFFGSAFNSTHNFIQTLDECIAARRTMHCGVWTNVPALLHDPGERRTRGHRTLDELCAIVVPLTCDRIVTFGVIRSPWERELSFWMWKTQAGHWHTYRGKWFYAHGGRDDVLAFQRHVLHATHLLRPVGEFVAGVHAADYVLRFEQLKLGADAMLQMLGGSNQAKLPMAKVGARRKNHARASEVDQWFAGCCACVDRIAQWHNRTRDLVLFGGNFTPPSCNPPQQHNDTPGQRRRNVNRLPHRPSIRRGSTTDEILNL